MALELEGTSGHAFFPGFDTFPDASLSHPWLTVGLEYACSYPGQGDLFVAHYRLIFSSAFK